MTTPAPWKRRIKGAASAILLTVAIVFIALGAVTFWLKTQVLDTDTWVETSRATIQEPEVRDAISVWAVDQVFERTDPADALAGALPERVAPLAGPLVSRLRSEAYGVANKALADPRVEDVWVTANRRAHERFVNIVHGKDPIVVETSNGMRIDLRPLLQKIAMRIGIDGSIVERIPASVTSVEPRRSEEVQQGLDLLQLLDRWGAIIGFIGLPFLAGGIWLARDRRVAWMWLGAGAIVAAFVLTRLANGIGPVVAEALTESSTWRAAVLSTWATVVQGLLDAAIAIGIVGVATIVLAWTTAGGGIQERARQFAAPVLVDRPVLAVGIGAVLATLLITYVPVLASRRISVQLLLIVGAMLVAWRLARIAAQEVDAPSVPSQP